MVITGRRISLITVAAGACPGILLGAITGGSSCGIISIAEIETRLAVMPLSVFTAVAPTNAVVILALIFGGFFAGIPTLVLCLAQGFSFARTLVCANASQIPVDLLLAAMAPHAVPELVALILAGGIGVDIASRMWSESPGAPMSLAREFIAAAMAARVPLLLIVIAGAAEAWVTRAVLLSTVHP